MPLHSGQALNLEGNSPPRGHQFCSVTQSCPTLCDLMTIARQASLSITKPKACSNLCPSSQEYHPTISSSVIPFPSCLQSLPAPGSFIMSQLFTSDSQVLELQDQSFQWTFRTDFLQDGLVGSPCSPKDSQESSPTSQFKSINFLVLSILYGPNHTSIHDHWKNHSFDQTDLCWQSNVSTF